MGNKTIFSVNTKVPGEDLLEIDYRSNQTLLDADIILFSPKQDSNWYASGVNSYFQGKKCLSEHGSFEAVKQAQHWKNEIAIAVNAGKLVIVYLVEPDECYRYTGEKQTSGTGRNQKVTNIVADISSYDALPTITSYAIKKGTKIKITKEGSFISPYWNELSEYASYHVEIEGQFSEVVLASETGSRVIGAVKRSKEGGTLLFLPPVNFYNNEFFKMENGSLVWTQDGLHAGKRFIAAIISLEKAILHNRIIIPPPDWTNADQYRLSSEGNLEARILQISKDLTRLEETKNTLQQDLAVTGWPRKLLYEKGTPLEDAILQSLKLMGFKADRFDDGESEFDAVFFASEGRFIGEAEGRDNKAIGIDKFSQLERNLHEDFSQEEVDEIAKGILFGNGYRLVVPGERTDIFTEKCLKAAKRTGIALVRTLDLFELTRYLIEHPEDQGYGAACRRAIAHTVGEIVEFPAPPIDNPVVIEKKSDDAIDDTE